MNLVIVQATRQPRIQRSYGDDWQVKLGLIGWKVSHASVAYRLPIEVGSTTRNKNLMFDLGCYLY
jgi:hypothetical protein